MMKQTIIEGTIKRNCEGCKESLVCYSGRTEQDKPFNLCADCYFQWYGVKLKQLKH